MPRETAHQPWAGRRPPAASGSGLRTAPQHPDPEVSTSSHTQDQVTRQRGWARDPSSSLSHQLCDARRQGMRHHITDKTEARQGQGDPRAHLCGLGCGAGRGEACARLGALIPRRSHSGNGECPLQENAGVQARARREGSAVPGWAPDHREDGRMDTGGSLCRQHTPPGGVAGAGPPRSSLGSVAAGRGPAHGNPRAGGGPTSGHSCKGRQLLPAAPVCPPDARRRGKATTDGDAPDQDTPSTGLPDGQGLHLPPGEDTQASGLGPWPVRLRPTPCWLIPKRCHAVASRKYLFVASQKLPSGGNGVCTHSVTRGRHRCRGLVFNWAQ